MSTEELNIESMSFQEIDLLFPIKNKVVINICEVEDEIVVPGKKIVDLQDKLLRKSEKELTRNELYFLTKSYELGTFVSYSVILTTTDSSGTQRDYETSAGDNKGNSVDLDKALEWSKKFETKCVPNDASTKVLVGSIERKIDERDYAQSVIYFHKKWGKYQKHLEVNPNKEKEPIVKDIVKKLTDDTKSYKERYEEFKQEWEIKNKKVIGKNADHAAILLIKNIGHALTFGIVSKFTKGTFAFWKAHGKVVGNKVEKFLGPSASRSRS